MWSQNQRYAHKRRSQTDRTGTRPILRRTCPYLQEASCCLSYSIYWCILCCARHWSIWTTPWTMCWDHAAKRIQVREPINGVVWRTTVHRRSPKIKRKTSHFLSLSTKFLFICNAYCVRRAMVAGSLQTTVEYIEFGGVPWRCVWAWCCFSGSLPPPLSLSLSLISSLPRLILVCTFRCSLLTVSRCFTILQFVGIIVIKLKLHWRLSTSWLMIMQRILEAQYLVGIKLNVLIFYQKKSSGSKMILVPCKWWNGRLIQTLTQKRCKVYGSKNNFTSICQFEIEFVQHYNFQSCLECGFSCHPLPISIVRSCFCYNIRTLDMIDYNCCNVTL